MVKQRNLWAKAGGKTAMRKIPIEISEEQYFFLKENILELKKNNLNATSFPLFGT